MFTLGQYEVKKPWVLYYRASGSIGLCKGPLEKPEVDGRTRCQSLSQSIVLRWCRLVSSQNLPIHLFSQLWASLAHFLCVFRCFHCASAASSCQKLVQGEIPEQPVSKQSSSCISHVSIADCFADSTGWPHCAAIHGQHHPRCGRLRRHTCACDFSRLCPISPQTDGVRRIQEGQVLRREE